MDEAKWLYETELVVDPVDSAIVRVPVQFRSVDDAAVVLSWAWRQDRAKRAVEVAIRALSEPAPACGQPVSAEDRLFTARFMLSRLLAQWTFVGPDENCDHLDRAMYGIGERRDEAYDLENEQEAA